MIIGPSETYSVDLRCRSEGMFCFTEPDGLRIVTTEHTYFFELVQDALKQTFALASIAPSAQLHYA